MTCKELIDIVDKLHVNKYDDELKFRWLSDIDGQIYNDILCTHEDNFMPEGFEGYDSWNDGETELIAAEPYTDLYRWYLEAQMDLANQEMNKYNNSKSMFNVSYKAFADAYNRQHMPLNKGGFRFTSGKRGVCDALSS